MLGINWTITKGIHFNKNKITKIIPIVKINEFLNKFHKFKLYSALTNYSSIIPYLFN